MSGVLCVPRGPGIQAVVQRWWRPSGRQLSWAVFVSMVEVHMTTQVGCNRVTELPRRPVAVGACC